MDPKTVKNQIAQRVLSNKLTEQKNVEIQLALMSIYGEGYRGKKEQIREECVFEISPGQTGQIETVVYKGTPILRFTPNGLVTTAERLYLKKKKRPKVKGFKPNV